MREFRQHALVRAETPLIITGRVSVPNDAGFVDGGRARVDSRSTSRALPLWGFYIL
jgi:hypothetical protein